VTKVYEDPEVEDSADAEQPDKVERAHMSKVALLLMGTRCQEVTARKKLVSLAALRAARPLTAEVREKIAAVHNAVVGHMGIKATRERLSRQGQHWPRMNADIRTFIHQCPFCQKESFVKPKNSAIPYTVSADRPMVRRAIDTIGPLPQDEDGNVGIISITDTFSRFNLLYPVPDMTAETAVTKALIPHMGIFGVPQQLVSDNGANFANQLVAELAKVSGFEQILITPDSHQENSLEERNHKEFMRHLRALLFEAGDMMRWSILAPLAQRIVNAQFRPAIGCSPTTMLFGATVDTDRGLFLEFSKREQKELDLSDETEQMLAVQSRLIRKAQELLKAHDAKHSEKHRQECERSGALNLPA
jgi:hypothetical protein